MLIRKVKRNFKIELNSNKLPFKIAVAFGFVLTILTFFSTPILEAIFGNGTVEVGNDHSYKTAICFRARIQMRGMLWRSCPGPTQMKMR